MTVRILAPAVDIETLVRHRRRFLRFVERYVANRDDAEDILQAALATSLEKGGGLRRGESVLAWFYRLLRNAITDHHRRRSARQRAHACLPRNPVSEPGFDRRLERNVCTCVLAELEDLKPAYAEMLRRVEIEEQALAAVARELKITANAARVRLHRARRALRERLELTCRACADHGCLDCTCRPRDRRRRL
ncbi:MAG: RNA polymerase sigma factor [Dehalococcoidia bacterium]